MTDRREACGDPGDRCGGCRRRAGGRPDRRRRRADDDAVVAPSLDDDHSWGHRAADERDHGAHDATDAGSAGVTDAVAIHVAKGDTRPTAPAPAVAVRRGDPDRMTVFLTFDAGSDTGYAAEILDTLAANRIRATFGITGRCAEANPALVRRMAAEGTCS